MVARNKYRPVHLRYSWLLVRLFRCNHDLGAVHAAETLDGDTDHPHLLMVSPRQAERADAAAAALPLACTGGSRRLPHWRHYTPATGYVNSSPHTLRSVLSMIDLDLAVGHFLLALMRSHINAIKVSASLWV